MRPSAANVLPDVVSGWPASGRAALFGERRKGGGFSNSGLLLPSADLAALSAAMRTQVANLESLLWASDYFFGVEIRGVKDITKHDPSDAAMRDLALSTMLQHIRATASFYVDVGMNIRLPNHALLWKSDKFSDIVREALECSELEANHIVTSSTFSTDTCSLIPGLAGFRVRLNHEGTHSAVYLQAYMTDKSQTYHLEGRTNYQRLTVPMAMNGNPPIFCRNLLNVYEDAAARTDVEVRLEIRVPIHHASSAFKHLRNYTFSDAICAFSRSLWW